MKLWLILGAFVVVGYLAYVCGYNAHRVPAATPIALATPTPTPNPKDTPEYQKALAEFKEAGFFATVSVKQVIGDGVIGSVCLEVPVTADDFKGREKEFEAVIKRGFAYQAVPDESVVRGLGRGLIDGSQWRGKIWEAGVCQFTTVLGAQRTVRQFATNPELAVELYLKSQ